MVLETGQWGLLFIGCSLRITNRRIPPLAAVHVSQACSIRLCSLTLNITDDHGYRLQQSWKRICFTGPAFAKPAPKPNPNPNDCSSRSCQHQSGKPGFWRNCRWKPNDSPVDYHQHSGVNGYSVPDKCYGRGVQHELKREHAVYSPGWPECHCNSYFRTGVGRVL